MYGKWLCFAVLDLVILTCSSPGRFYHDYHYHTSHAEWSQGWQHDWFETTPRPTRRRTTTARVETTTARVETTTARVETTTARIETTTTPVPTLPQPVIKDIEIRLGESETSDSQTPSPRPITLIQEEISSSVKEQDIAPQTVVDSGPKRNSGSFQSTAANAFGTAESYDDIPNQQAETVPRNDDNQPQAVFTPSPEQNRNSFGIAALDETVEADSQSKPEQETPVTNKDKQPQAVFENGPEENSRNFQIAPISTIDKDHKTETKPDSKRADKEDDDDDYHEGYSESIDALDAIRGEEKGEASDQQAPLLDASASMWHVAIYEKKKGRYELICGGSLIKADMVISAGHCFWSPLWQALPAALFRVAAGKLYPRYDDPRDTAAQYSDVRNMSISDMAEDSCMQPDLVYMTLVRRFQYTSAVKPVCFSLDYGLESRQLKEGDSGMVARWTAVEKGVCKPLRHKWLSLPFVKHKECRYEVSYKTTGGNRICAGESELTECPTDFGNGLVFYHDKIPYLRGVATKLPVHRGCAIFHSRSFTNIIDETLTKYLKGITDVYNLGECEELYKNPAVKNKTESGYGEGFVEIDPPEKKPDDSDGPVYATAIGSKPVPTLPDSSAPLYQWHVGVYSKLWSPHMQICGGSLVKRDFVISAAHCFWDDASGQQPASQFAVAGGKLFRPWNNTQDTYAQHSDISEIILPIRFRGATTSFQDDIAILRLSTPFTYAPGVQSVCVDFDRQFEMAQLWPGNIGTILGWGLTEQNGSPSQRLMYLELAYVDVQDCYADSDPSFLKYITSDKICAGDTVTGKALCRGDSGGGLVLYSSSTPYLHGVASTAAGNQHLCNAFALAAFTSTYSHRAFLRDHIPGIDKECVKPESGTTNRDTGHAETSTAAAGTRESPLYTNVPYFPYPNHFVCNCNCKP